MVYLVRIFDSSRMKFFRDTQKSQSLIEKTIQVYGHAAEHNYHWYEYCRKPNEQNIFVHWPDGTGLMTVENPAKREAYVFSSPLAPARKRIMILLEYLDYLLKKKSAVNRVEVELDTQSRRDLTHSLPSYLRERAPMATMTSPVMDMAGFDSLLSGKHFKSLRHARNRFYREYRVEVLDARQYSKDDLIKIVDEWRIKRPARDRVDYDQYYNLIKGNFEGTKGARAFVVNGKSVGFNAGWPIPHSRRYYAAVGIHTYSLPDLGQMLYLEDLSYIKEKGYSEADMGASGPRMLTFKNQFHPSGSYRTHFFAIVRNDAISSRRASSHKTLKNK